LKSNSQQLQRFLTTAARILLGVLFLLAATPKILWPADFAKVIFFYQILPYDLVNALAIVLPWIELYSAIALLFSRSLRQAAAWIILGLLVIFTAAIVTDLCRGIDISCGCFSVATDAESMGIRNVVRNACMIVLTMLVIRNSHDNKYLLSKK